jgi:echinoderm microtubule-associated protein-like 6
MAIWDIKTRK